MNFVSLPGITVLDVHGHGSAVSILGFKISDGLSADKLDEFREVILGQLDRWEMGIDAELGRFLADKSANGLLSVGWDGEFNLLLDSKKKTMGNHLALEGPTKKGMHYLPPNFDEEIEKDTEQDERFIALTGISPTPGRKTTKALSKKSEVKKLPASKETPKETAKETPSSNKYDFSNIIDVELEDEDDD